jgi:gamma-glutamyltranspeptidase/glutathione hydrolase
MSPTLVFDHGGRLAMAVGSPGGSAIINYTTKALVATLVWGLDIQSAISLPNFGSRNGPTEIEQGTIYEWLVPALIARGHEVRLIEQTSGLHGIERLRSGWRGGADPRREGVARGR